ncbi:MAG TPA: hypothetical protein VKW78_02865 [Terriglobales bacterium]|nr:hypothetical protein [Terriglobales bacterium]
MHNSRLLREWKIFDPRDPSTAAYGDDMLDATFIQREKELLMVLAGQPGGHGATDLYSARLPEGAPLSAVGWSPIRDAAGQLLPLSERRQSSPWDGKGGRHCPSYVKGWNPEKNAWVERIYYAGAAENLWGPYTIGFLEWDGEQWQDQPEPAFVANEDWEHGSVYEPNLVYHDGKWKMWYVAGSNHEDYLVHGYSESANGRTGWSQHAVFADPEMKMFDFCVRQRENEFEAIFARVWMGRGEMPQETGLWWCRAHKPSGRLSEWSAPVQIMDGENRGWHAGPWKPSLQFATETGRRGLIFFDGSYQTTDPGPFPFAFTLGCVEVELPNLDTFSQK